MLCAISGEAPQEPVVSKKSGIVYEKRLIQQYIGEHGTEPGSGDALVAEDLLPIKSAAIVRPRPPTLTSIPALLATFQTEWDSLALETYNLREQLSRTREELATALYQHDAAVRVIARLSRERDEARHSLSKVTVIENDANGDKMMLDNVEILPEALAARVDELHRSLSQERKGRAIPEEWVTPQEVSAFESIMSNPLSLARVNCLTLKGEFVALGDAKGEVSIYSLSSDAMVRQMSLGEPVTDVLWVGEKFYFTTTLGSIKVFEGGEMLASLSEHTGPATGLSMHPGGEILASVGTDKSIVFYETDTFTRLSRVHNDHALTTCAFHPDGHLFATGDVSGDVRLFRTTTLEQAASYQFDGPIQAISFSEKGFWLATAVKGKSAVTMTDLRKSGPAASKELEASGPVLTLDWDYTGQFLAAGSDSGLTVHQYTRSTKQWNEIFRDSVPTSLVRWGTEGKKLVSVNEDGAVIVFGPPEEEEEEEPPQPNGDEAQEEEEEEEEEE
ncbi:hypothetical protein CDD82_7902 [Ophiocordyceps australis]|uniref:Pre-mRNA-processing factor 19 n=1 Tax=Ophiocordyceps australis TaxID=1399860 RepID=A0A2C5YNN9_9HYPO|nr:hypothetical protein CDD82_7902 [Ophiocordyceps australis]